MTRQTFITILGLLVLLWFGWALRSKDLVERPMHTDEAILADKFAVFQESGIFEYDPADYHGPGLHYLTLPFAWIAGESDYVELSEHTLRMVPLLCGLGLLVFLYPLRRTLGTAATLWIAFLTALSPMLVYYSRYYIMEMPFVLFTFGFITCGWRFLIAPSDRKKERLAWIVGSGIFAGLMHATKETCAVSFLAIFGSIGICLLIERRGKPSALLADFKTYWRPLAICIGTAVVLSALLYSNFFRNGKAVVDSYMTYFSYSERAGGVGHEDEWDYYVDFLYKDDVRGKEEALSTLDNYSLTYEPFPKPRPAFIMGERIMVRLAFIAAILALTPFLGRIFSSGAAKFTRFLLFYAAITVLIYSLIPYKTPWTIMSFHHAVILLAGIGVSAAFTILLRFPRKWIGIPLAAAGAAVLTFYLYHLFAYTRWTNLGRYTWQQGDANRPLNPFVYSHTTPRAISISNVAHSIARIHPDGNDMLIHVVSSESWPLPWYLRDLSRVGYHLEFVPSLAAAPVLIMDSEIAYEAAVENEETKDLLAERYLILPGMELRSGYVISVLVERSLWDKIEDRDAAQSTKLRTF